MSIKIQNLSKVYGQQTAVNQINFEIKRGEIVGFLGPNGAGKSTTMKILSGYLKPTEGKALLNDQEIDTDSKEIKRHIGYLPEHNPLYLDMYVEEFLNFAGSLYGLKNPQLKARTAEIIALVGLGPEKHKKIIQLSKGYRQRVGLAQALIHDPDVLILDEPTTGLDPNQLVEIRELIRQVGKNKTVILSTHIMQEVDAICDRVIIINHGNIVADAALKEIKQDGKSLEEIFRKLTSA